ncbi:MAG: EamA family transporter [Flavobacteriales bacterium]|nr:EamA family transporter [Flavobacteriales bacterium]
MNLSKTQSLILLHCIILIWGFTGVLGKLIDMPSTFIVWNRMLIAFFSLFIINILIYKKTFPHTKKALFNYLFIGTLITIHWICFFEAIKQSTVSLALICLSSISLFTSILEPLIQKRKILIYELLLSILVIIGILIIYKHENIYNNAIILAVTSAFFGALFTVLNHKLIKTGHKAMIITTWEMFGGMFLLTIYLILTKELNIEIIPTGNNIIYILILALICTAFAFSVSIEIMKKITPFTVNLSVNLEPIYAIILALLIFGENEKMSTEFYFGATIIIFSILLNTFVKKKKVAKNN